MIKFIIYFYVVIMTLMGSFAALFLKKASGSGSIRDLIFNINFYIGGGLYLLSALINIYVLRKLPYSTVLPMTSITYIWTIIISYYALNESVSNKKIIGVMLIVIGAVTLTII